MNGDQATDNRRILVIDDNVNIHEDFRKVLMPPIDSDLLTQARAALFGEVPPFRYMFSMSWSLRARGVKASGLFRPLIREGIPLPWRLGTSGCRRDGMGS